MGSWSQNDAGLAACVALPILATTLSIHRLCLLEHLRDHVNLAVPLFVQDQTADVSNTKSTNSPGHSQTSPPCVPSIVASPGPAPVAPGAARTGTRSRWSHRSFVGSWWLRRTWQSTGGALAEGGALGGVHSHGGSPIAGWFLENPQKKWMIWRYPYFRRPQK